MSVILEIVSKLVWRVFVVVGVGYSKLKEKPASQESSDSSTLTGAVGAKVVVRIDSQKPVQPELVKNDAANKPPSKSHDLLAETARFVKRAVGTSDRYKQFVDVDLDETENFIAAEENRDENTNVSPVVTSKKQKSAEKKALDSLSSGKKPSKQAVAQVCGVPVAEGQSIGRSGEPAPRVQERHVLKTPILQTVIASNPVHPQALCHESGEQLLLENDELLEGEPPRSKGNPFLGFGFSKDSSSKEFGGHVADGKLFGVPAVTIQPNFDVFGAAPFRRKLRQNTIDRLTGALPLSCESDTLVLIKDADDARTKKDVGERFMDCAVDADRMSGGDTFQIFRQCHTSTGTTASSPGRSSAIGGGIFASDKECLNPCSATGELDQEVSDSVDAADSIFQKMFKTEIFLPRARTSDAKNAKLVMPSSAPVVRLTSQSVGEAVKPDIFEGGESAFGVDCNLRGSFDTPADCLLEASSQTSPAAGRVAARGLNEVKLKGLILPFSRALGDEGRSSPRNSRKEKPFPLDDKDESPVSTKDGIGENPRGAVPRKPTKEKTLSSQFANLGFTEDPDALYHYDAHESDMPVHGQSSDSDESFMLEGNHTFPKSGAKKQRSATVTLDHKKHTLV